MSVALFEELDKELTRSQDHGSHYMGEKALVVYLPLYDLLMGQALAATEAW